MLIVRLHSPSYRSCQARRLFGLSVPLGGRHAFDQHRSFGLHATAVLRLIQLICLDVLVVAAIYWYCCGDYTGIALFIAADAIAARPLRDVVEWIYPNRIDRSTS